MENTKYATNFIQLERMQPGAGRIGGKWERILMDGHIKYTLLSQGRKSSYASDQYDMEYVVITGNY